MKPAKLVAHPPGPAKPVIVKGLPAPARPVGNAVPAKPAIAKDPPVPARPVGNVVPAKPVGNAVPAKPAIVKGPPLPARPVGNVVPAKPVIVKVPTSVPVKPTAVKLPINGVNKLDVAKEAAAKAAEQAAKAAADKAAKEAAAVRAAKAAVEEAAKAAAARRAAITWPKTTMTDPEVVKHFVRCAYGCWCRLKTMGAIEGPRCNRRLVVTELAKVLDGIHRDCGVPKVELEIYTGRSTSCGFFVSGYNTWKMKINEGRLSTDSIAKSEVYSLIETLYHEGRHSEQVWLVLVQSLFEKREWSSLQNKYEVPNAFLSRRTLSEPNDVLQKALNEAVKRREEPVIGDREIYYKYRALKEKIKKWDEETTKNGKDTECIYQNSDKSSHWFHKYQTIPTEYDAFLIEELVREEFKKIGEFRDTAIQAAPGPCRHCHGKNNQHIFSGLPLSMVR